MRGAVRDLAVKSTT